METQRDTEVTEGDGRSAGVHLGFLKVSVQVAQLLHTHGTRKPNPRNTWMDLAFSLTRLLDCQNRVDRCAGDLPLHLAESGGLE